MYLSDIYTISINLAGLPAISLPVDKDNDGMPVGLQLIAKAYDEQTLFDGALSLEENIQYQK
jgi:aspartyl-tRNA(Asn)/glutamyl-tRNA(Gln) amidotransferase subunit A